MADRRGFGEKRRDFRMNINFCFNTTQLKKDIVEQYCADNDRSVASYFREWLRKKLGIKGRSTADWLDEYFITDIINKSKKGN